jgi:TRAP-type mannitol/chloroaromatic compound transport system substrate-binding protein
VAKSETILEIHPFSPLALDQTKSLEAFSEDVATLTGGEIQFRIAKSVRSTKPFEKIENVSRGLIDASFGHTHLLSNQYPSAILFGSPPIANGVEFDNTTFFSWFYSAGGAQLYDDMWEELNLNVKGFILQSSGPQALGWFRDPIFSLDNFKGKRFRDSSDFSNRIHKDIGISIIPMKAADILPELDKQNLDAASWCCPSRDLTLGLQKSIRNYYLQGITKTILNADLYLNKEIYDELTLQQQKAIEIAATASVARHTSFLIYENGKALKELVEDHDVRVNKTPKEYFKEYKNAAEKFLEEKAEESDFFAKVWQSQKDFAIIGLPYWSETQTSSNLIYD